MFHELQFSIYEITTLKFYWNFYRKKKIQRCEWTKIDAFFFNWNLKLQWHLKSIYEREFKSHRSFINSKFNCKLLFSSSFFKSPRSIPKCVIHVLFQSIHRYLFISGHLNASKSIAKLISTIRVERKHMRIHNNALMPWELAKRHRIERFAVENHQNHIRFWFCGFSRTNGKRQSWS